VSRSLHRLACLALLGLLSGVPAVICAELCVRDVHHARTEHGDSACHGRTAGGAAIAGQPVRDCGDHGEAAIGAASLAGSRGDALAMHLGETLGSQPFAASPWEGDGLASIARGAVPPRPARSSRILRI
jgi:hypothetical protein